MISLPRLLAVTLIAVSLVSCSSLRKAFTESDTPSEPRDRQDEGLDLSSIDPAFLDAVASNPDAAPGLAFVARSVRSVQKANEDLTPQQEYYLGRAFGANILASRSPLANVDANRYVNLLGQALAQYSDRPETWVGYRFLILDSNEVNAFAAPGGFIFVSKGLIKLTRNEAELAAVLAHEIGHVEQEHGLKAIRKDRLTSAALGIGSDAAQTFGSGRMQELTAAFKDSIGDLTKTIVNTGYSRETEYEADAAACRILTRAGYSAQAMVSVLELLKKLPSGGEGGFSRTHPKPDDRIAQVKKIVGKSKSVNVTGTQKRRFQAAMGGL